LDKGIGIDLAEFRCRSQVQTARAANVQSRMRNVSGSRREATIARRNPDAVEDLTMRALLRYPEVASCSRL